MKISEMKEIALLLMQIAALLDDLNIEYIAIKRTKKQPPINKLTLRRLFLQLTEG